MTRVALAAIPGVAIGVGLCVMLGGTTHATSAVVGGLAIVAAVGVGPALSPKALQPGNLGMVVLGVTLVQTLLAIGIALVLVGLFGLDRRPVVLGTFGGVFGMMVMQALAGMSLLQSRGQRETGGAGVSG